MSERTEEIIRYKTRALTGELHRMAHEAGRWRDELHSIRAIHRGAVESFEAVRRRAQHTGEVTDRRLGRFYIEALRHRLILERGAVLKLADRLADTERRASTVQREVSTAMARLKRLEEIGGDRRLEKLAAQERRAENAVHEVWGAQSRPEEGGVERNEAGISGSGAERGEGAGLTANDVTLTLGRDPRDAASPSSLDSLRSGVDRVTTARRGASSGRSDHPPPFAEGTALTGSAPVLAGAACAGSQAKPSPRVSSDPIVAALRQAARSEMFTEVSTGQVTSVENRTDGGLSLTYRSASGGGIEVGIARARNGALEVAFSADRPGDRHRLERERRGLVDSLRERGYVVERIVIGGPRREVSNGGE